MSSAFLEKFLRSLKEKGWKQKEIADLLGITHQHASRLFHGAQPSLDIVLKLAEYFDVSTDEVLGRIECRKDKLKKGSNSINNCIERGQTI